MIWKNQFVKSLLLGISVTLAISGCGPVQYTAKYLDATAAIEAAHVENAWKQACYEYYASIRYLQKAMEEAGFSDFEAAANYADKSWKLAVAARNLARERKIKRKYIPVMCQAPPKILKFYKKKKAPKRIRMEKRIVD